MTIIRFLKLLNRKGKLKLVESSEEIMKSYLEKSERSLLSSRVLLDNNLLEDSVSMAYYSMYNSLLSLLFYVGIKCENHSGSIILLKEVFEIDNSNIGFAKKERVDKQYYVDFRVVKNDVVELLKITEDFKGEMSDFISRLNASGIEFYRKKFIELI